MSYGVVCEGQVYLKDLSRFAYWFNCGPFIQ